MPVTADNERQIDTEGIKDKMPDFFFIVYKTKHNEPYGTMAYGSLHSLCETLKGS